MLSTALRVWVKRNETELTWTGLVVACVLLSGLILGR